jgi:hypothetical protein
MDFVNRLIELEKMLSIWKRFTNFELLLAIGETPNETNIEYMEQARNRL